MAIVQISRITNRKGLQADLPQLAGAELGWSIDTRRLFIGNGTLQEGAPVIGNTEILTEFTDILAFQTNYTYKGEAAGYTVQTSQDGNPISQSLQSWLDQFATVKDFGAVGDGVTDDTDAINWALLQLFCREISPLSYRRSLFFPAGVYRITGAIKIPPYATLIGEGINNSVISLDADSIDDYVVVTADNNQQTGANIGLNGAVAPQFITINNLGFQNNIDTSSILLVDSAIECTFQNVGFVGPLGTVQLVDSLEDSAGVRFASNYRDPTQITFTGCRFSGTTYAVETNNQVKSVTITNSKFDILYQGVVLGTGSIIGSGPTGFKITGNMFDNIYAEGIVFGDVQLNASGHNIFYDVGNHFAGAINPASAIINIQNNNNLSISDLFERSDAFATEYYRVDLNNSTSIGIDNSAKIQMGSYVRTTGNRFTLVDNTASSAVILSNPNPNFILNYSINRINAFRNGTLAISFDPNDSTLTYDDSFVQNADTGITLIVSQVGTTAQISYTSTSTGQDGQLTYSINHFLV